MANTYRVLVSLVNQFESLSQLVILLANTHIEDEETIATLTTEAETVKQQAADAIKQAQEAEAKALTAQAQAEEVLSLDQQEEDLATRFSASIDSLIETAKKALPPSPEPVEQPTNVNIAEPTINA